VIDGLEVAASDLVDGVGVVVEEDLFGDAGELEPVLEICRGLVARELGQGGDVCEAPSDGLELVTLEELVEARVAGEDHREDGPRIELEVGQDAKRGEDVGPHVLFVDEEDGAQPLLVDLFREALLELAQEVGIVADGG
jgi:hypothetical protein